MWSLHPVNGVNVKISDCGLSQFTTPLGLHRQKGTEDYMAPELFTNGRKWSYDEKVCALSYILNNYNRTDTYATWYRNGDSSL